MEALQLLSRSEMKNVKGGLVDCQWDSCRDTSSYYGCLGGKCLSWYSGAEALDCQRQVNRWHENMIYNCNINYQ